MAAPGIISIKTFTFRDAPEEWSNRYHFQGSPPSTEADWRSLVDDFVLLEKTAVSDVNSIVRFLCYANTDDDSVYTYDLTAFGGAVPGTNTGGPSSYQSSGDVAYDIRWNTGRRTSTNKPIYLRKYLHGAYHEAGDRDKLDSTMLANCQTFAGNVETTSGAWPGLAGPDGVAPTGYLTLPYLTTRTLKRRGRRPT